MRLLMRCTMQMCLEPEQTSIECRRVMRSSMRWFQLILVPLGPTPQKDCSTHA